MEFLKNHEWTGNVRELENLIERVVTLTSPDIKTIDIGILPAEFQDEWEYVRTQSPVMETSETAS